MDLQRVSIIDIPFVIGLGVAALVALVASVAVLRGRWLRYTSRVVCLLLAVACASTVRGRVLRGSSSR